MIKTSYAIFINLVSLMILTWYFNNIMEKNYDEKSKLQEKLWQLQDDCNLKYQNKISYKVTVTTYNPTRRQCDSTPNITADGTRINPKKATQYRYVALSRDLLSRWGGPFEYGDYIVIEGTDGRDGVYQVRDTMNPRWTNRVDILTTNSRFKYDNIVMYKYIDEEYLLTDNNY